mmetsp:Transcript_25097/g.86648  ORF Transcript_25097/g.86648 Transcript_25097/m.86648 type:complete len:253 (+) Transcript_25097:700-1458(+)
MCRTHARRGPKGPRRVAGLLAIPACASRLRPRSALLPLLSILLAALLVPMRSSGGASLRRRPFFQSGTVGPHAKQPRSNARTLRQRRPRRSRPFSTAFFQRPFPKRARSNGRLHVVEGPVCAAFAGEAARPPLRRVLQKRLGQPTFQSPECCRGEGEGEPGAGPAEEEEPAEAVGAPFSFRGLRAPRKHIHEKGPLPETLGRGSRERGSLEGCSLRRTSQRPLARRKGPVVLLVVLAVSCVGPPGLDARWRR